MSIPEVSKSTDFQWPFPMVDDLAPEVPHYLTFQDLRSLYMALAHRADAAFKKLIPMATLSENNLHFSTYVLGVVISRKLCLRSVTYKGCLTLKEYQCLGSGIFPKKYTLYNGTQVKETQSSVQKIHPLYKSIAYLDLRQGCSKQAIRQTDIVVMIQSLKGKGPFLLSWATIKCIYKFDMKRLALTGYPENKRQDYAFTGVALAEIKDIAKKSYETNKIAKRNKTSTI